MTGIFLVLFEILGYLEGVLRRDSSLGSRGGGSRLCKQEKSGRLLESKEAIIFIRPINEHTYNIDDSNAQGQAARKARKAQHYCKKNLN